MILHNEKTIIKNRTISNLADLERGQIPAEYVGREGYLIRVRDSIFFNQHRLVNLPIRASYLIKVNGIRLRPELGLVINLSQNSEDYFNSDLLNIPSQNNYFKNRIGMSYRASCKVLIPTGKKFSFYIRPSFEWNPSDIIASGKTIRQERSLLRFDVGISRNF